MKRVRLIWLVPFLMMLGFTVGCGSDLNTVTGTVTLDGEPLPNATVVLTPMSGGRPVGGETDEQGKYEVIHSRAGKGTIIGEHVVEITTRKEEAMEDDTVKITPEKVPARYNSPSELKVTVKEGANVFDFDLKSEGEIIQGDQGESEGGI